MIFVQQDKCEICGVGEVADLLDSQGALLQTRLAVLGKGPPVLVLDTRPSGRWSTSTARSSARPRSSGRCSPGARRSGSPRGGLRRRGKRELTFVPGAREEVVIELQRTPGNPR